MVQLRLLAILTASLATVPLPAAASSCQEAPFAAQMQAADVIFTGRARTIDGELATTFDVERIYKGDVPAKIIVETGSNKYAMLEPPHRYLVLAVRAEAQPGNLFVRTCSGSLREPWPADTRDELGAGKPPPAAAPEPSIPPPPSPPEQAGPPPSSRMPCAIDDAHAPWCLLLALLPRRRRRR